MSILCSWLKKQIQCAIMFPSKVFIRAFITLFTCILSRSFHTNHTLHRLVEGMVEKCVYMFYSV